MGWNLVTLCASMVILLCVQFNWQLSTLLLAPAWLALFVMTIVWQKRSGVQAHLWVFEAGTLLPILSLTLFAYSSVSNQRFSAQSVTDAENGRLVWLVGQVDDLPVTSLAGRRFLFSVQCGGSRKGECAALPYQRLSVNWQDAPDIVPGDTWQIAVKLKPLRQSLSGSFNLEAWAKQNRINGQGRVVEAEEARRLAQSWTLNRVRMHLVKKVMEQLDADKPSSQLFPALIVGARSSLSDEQWRTMSLSGTTHLFAISGVHVTFLASLVYIVALFFIRRCYCLTQRWPAQNITALLAYFFALGYGFLAGLSIPTLRTLVMLTILLAVKLSYRNIAGLRLFLLTLLGVLLIDPFSGLSVGFWLSFMAVGLLIWIDRTENGFSIFAAIRTQWWISIGMIPLTLLYFRVLPLLGFFANLIAIPLLGSVVVPLALFATLFIFIQESFAQCLFEIAQFLLELVWAYLSWLTHFSFAAMEHVTLPIPNLVVLALGTALLLLPRGAKVGTLALAAILLPCLQIISAPPETGVKVRLFGGDDQTIILQSGKQTLLIKNGEISKQLEQYLSGHSIKALSYWYAPSFRMSGLNNRVLVQTQLIQAQMNQGDLICPAEIVLGEAMIRFFPIESTEPHCGVRISTSLHQLVILPNAIKRGFNSIPLERGDRLIAHAGVLSSDCVKQQPAEILIASRKTERNQKHLPSGIPVQWIFGKETELVLN